MLRKKINKNLLFFILIVYVVFFLTMLIMPKVKNEVCVNEVCVLVEIADSPKEIEEGLMFREELEGGMLFVFDDGVHKFWMKDTLISLDVIWINENMEIIQIETLEPCEKCSSYGPDSSVRYVLEVNAGFVEANDIEIGDVVKLNVQKSL